MKIYNLARIFILSFFINASITQNDKKREMGLTVYMIREEDASRIMRANQLDIETHMPIDEKFSQIPITAIKTVSYKEVAKDYPRDIQQIYQYEKLVYTKICTKFSVDENVQFCFRQCLVLGDTTTTFNGHVYVNTTDKSKDPISIEFEEGYYTMSKVETTDKNNPIFFVFPLEFKIKIPENIIYKKTEDPHAEENKEKIVTKETMNSSDEKEKKAEEISKRNEEEAKTNKQLGEEKSTNKKYIIVLALGVILVIVVISVYLIKKN